MGSAMWMYDLTGGVAHRQAPSSAEEGSGVRSPADDAEGTLASAYLYFDATVDDARLCLTVARTAADRVRSSSMVPGGRTDEGRRRAHDRGRRRRADN
jgi:glycerol-3-phosphate dehydrogenase